MFNQNKAWAYNLVWVGSLFIITLFSPNKLPAQERYVLQKFQGEMVFDGLSNDPGWQDIETLPLIMFQPEYGGEPEEFTELKVAYDENYLYFSGVMHDSQPEIPGNGWGGGYGYYSFPVYLKPE